MAIDITYFCHGTTTDNEAGISSGWKDAELSKMGIKQSIYLSAKIVGKNFDIVFCSMERPGSRGFSCRRIDIGINMSKKKIIFKN